MSGSANDVHSRSGVQPLTGPSITEYRGYANALGEEFGLLDYHYFILQLLYLVEYANYNSTLKLGAGYTNASHTGPIASGGCDILGMHSGSVDGSDNSSVIYRGIEDIFGNIWQFVDGINVKDYQAYICYDRNQYEVNKFDGCYQPIGYVNANQNGYISKLGYDANNSLVALPIETLSKDSINKNKNICDVCEPAAMSTFLIVGGYYNSGAYSGLWYYAPNNVYTFYHQGIGSRLLKIE